jgi:2-keto-4-pentenoate hydratase/2-oxohepta-3-ene-1,7-dioic acid hydratase in catechol pathway
MRLGTFRRGDRIFVGVVKEDLVIDLAATAIKLPGSEQDDRFSDMKRTIVNLPLIDGVLAKAAGAAVTFPLSELTVLAPILNPEKIICIGLNYLDHAKESEMALPEEPVFFNKFNSSLTGPDSPVIMPRLSTQIDYEGELAVVIGKRGKYIPQDQAMSYVAGYTAFNDVSARDLQFRGGQWIKGKALDSFAPLGPYLVTASEIADPHRLKIRTLLNGVAMQDSTTAMMIFKIPRLISFLSELFTLEPGDLIATGTPPGVGFARKPPVFMKPGDRVTVSIEGIGDLTNPVVGPER